MAAHGNFPFRSSWAVKNSGQPSLLVKRSSFGTSSTNNPSAQIWTDFFFNNQNAVLAGTEPTDTAAVSVSIIGTAALAATEAQDTASISAAIVASSFLAATESPDTVSFALLPGLLSSLSATEPQDTANFAVVRTFTFVADFGAYTSTGYLTDWPTGKGIPADPAYFAVTGNDAILTQNLPFFMDAGYYSATGYNIRLFKSSFIYEDSEIIRVPSAVNYIMVPGENRFITLQKDYTVEELFEDRVVDAEARLRA